MEKLELKHLAPYLPYGLKIQGQTHGEIVELSCVTETSVNIKDRNFAYGMWSDIFDIKPILRPLSDLKVRKDTYGEYNWEYPLEFKQDIKHGQASYDCMVNLFKEHIDVFGLIEKGLAIDINTLKQ